VPRAMLRDGLIVHFLCIDSSSSAPVIVRASAPTYVWDGRTHFDCPIYLSSWVRETGSLAAFFDGTIKGIFVNGGGLFAGGPGVGRSRATINGLQGPVVIAEN